MTGPVLYERFFRFPALVILVAPVVGGESDLQASPEGDQIATEE